MKPQGGQSGWPLPSDVPKIPEASEAPAWPLPSEGPEVPEASEAPGWPLPSEGPEVPKPPKHQTEFIDRWAQLGYSGPMGPLGAGATWGPLGPLGAPWGHLGPLGATRGHSGPLGATWGHLGPLGTRDRARDQGPRDQGTKRPGTRDPGTQGPRDPGTQGPRDQGSGIRDQGQGTGGEGPGTRAQPQGPTSGIDPNWIWIRRVRLRLPSAFQPSSFVNLLKGFRKESPPSPACNQCCWAPLIVKKSAQT